MVRRLLLLTILLLNAPAFAAAPVSRMVNVNGVSLEYLDWGGGGPPLVFLAGLSDTPYIYNELAPAFTSLFHCYGLTRRGHGRSEAGSGDYTLEAMVGDVAVFLKTLDLTGVTLVGHSYGGTEAVRFAQRYPEVVRRSVVLDLAYASPRTGPEMPWDAMDAVMAKLGAVVLGPKASMASLDNYRRFLTQIHRSWSEAAEANLREQVEVRPDGTFTPRMSPKVNAQFWADRFKWFVTKMPVPALFVFSNNPMADLAQGLAVDAALANEIQSADMAMQARRRAQIDAIRRDSPQATIVELEHTAHRNFIHKRDRTIEEMRRFLAEPLVTLRGGPGRSPFELTRRHRAG
jgi:pimeloyl-ACP methyl ester carboxylesterase